METHWGALLSECQFAISQTVVGLETLASVGHRDQRLSGGSDLDLRYRLHDAFAPLATGIERLAKLAISLERYSATAEFPSVKGYRHNITKLVEELAETEGAKQALLDERVRTLGPHIELLTDFAENHQRYEYLDALSGPAVEEGQYRRWCELAERTAVSEDVQNLCWIPSAIEDALIRASNLLNDECGIGDLETLVMPYIDHHLKTNLFPPAVEVALDYFRLSRSLATLLGNRSEQLFYGEAKAGAEAPTLPLLTDITSRQLAHSAESFLRFNILGLEDAECTIEALEEFHTEDTE